MFRPFLIFFVGILFCSSGFAQEIEVRGRFLTDSVKIGEPVAYSFSVHYPASMHVVFPDSAFAYTPFEFGRKKYFPTRTRNQISIDSAVYFFSTFEIDSLQMLALPVFVIHRADCTAVFSEPDTVRLHQLVGRIPDAVEAKDLPLKTNADYLNVQWLLNYPLLLLIAGALLLVLVALWIAFGKRIRKYFRLRSLAKRHRAFLEHFGRQVERVKLESSATAAESTLVTWKKYMEGLVAKPYTKFTTKEILRQAGDENLGQALHYIDRLVYARAGGFSAEAFHTLQVYAQAQFNQKTEEVKRG